MRALIQRVTSASVSVAGEVTGAIDQGMLVLLGVGPEDSEASAEALWRKMRGLRIFDDGDGKMNLPLEAVGGRVLVVSQFTLYADCRRGMRPSFTGAAAPERAHELYEHFCGLVRRDIGTVAQGVFGAEMQVSLVNDGPVTIWLDTNELARKRSSRG